MQVQTDILLEVMRAADPVAAQATLSRLGAAESGRSGTFATALPGVDPAAISQFLAAGSPLGGPAVVDPRVALQTLLLKDMLETMLPKADDKMFGAGMAGDVWRSQMSEQLAQAISKSNPGLLGLPELAGGDHEGAVR